MSQKRNIIFIKKKIGEIEGKLVSLNENINEVQINKRINSNNTINPQTTITKNNIKRKKINYNKFPKLKKHPENFKNFQSFQLKSINKLKKFPNVKNKNIKNIKNYYNLNKTIESISNVINKTPSRKNSVNNNKLYITEDKRYNSGELIKKIILKSKVKHRKNNTCGKTLSINLRNLRHNKTELQKIIAKPKKYLESNKEDYMFDKLMKNKKIITSKNSNTKKNNNILILNYTDNSIENNKINSNIISESLLTEKNINDNNKQKTKNISPLNLKIDFFKNNYQILNKIFDNNRIGIPLTVRNSRTLDSFSSYDNKNTNNSNKYFSNIKNNNSKNKIEYKKNLYFRRKKNSLISYNNLINNNSSFNLVNKTKPNIKYVKFETPKKNSKINYEIVVKQLIENINEKYYEKINLNNFVEKYNEILDENIKYKNIILKLFCLYGKSNCVYENNLQIADLCNWINKMNIEDKKQKTYVNRGTKKINKKK